MEIASVYENLTFHCFTAFATAIDNFIAPIGVVTATQACPPLAGSSPSIIKTAFNRHRSGN